MNVIVLVPKFLPKDLIRPAIPSPRHASIPSVVCSQVGLEYHDPALESVTLNDQPRGGTMDAYHGSAAVESQRANTFSPPAPPGMPTTESESSESNDESQSSRDDSTVGDNTAAGAKPNWDDSGSTADETMGHGNFDTAIEGNDARAGYQSAALSGGGVSDLTDDDQGILDALLGLTVSDVASRTAMPGVDLASGIGSADIGPGLDSLGGAQAPLEGNSISNRGVNDGVGAAMKGSTVVLASQIPRGVAGDGEAGAGLHNSPENAGDADDLGNWVDDMLDNILADD